MTLQVMGGYDFPGSNSNIDLHALTGWIPERSSIGDKGFDKEKQFRKIMDKFHEGQVLVTVATGELSETVADKAGTQITFSILKPMVFLLKLSRSCYVPRLCTLGHTRS